MDVSLLIFIVFRCLTGPSTTVFLEEPTEKVGSMQLIFQRRFIFVAVPQTHLLYLLVQIMLLTQLFLFFYNSSFLFHLSLFRSYHGYKTMKDFVRRRRWARYYTKQHWYILVSAKLVLKVHHSLKLTSPFDLI